MADRWSDERDSEWRNRDWERSERYGRGRESDDARRRTDEGRSFGPEQRPQDRWPDGDRDRVFGERGGHPADRWSPGEAYGPVRRGYRVSEERGARDGWDRDEARYDSVRGRQPPWRYGGDYAAQEDSRWAYERDEARTYGWADHHPDHETPNVRGGRGDPGRSWWDRTKDQFAAMFGDDDAERRARWDRQMGDHRGRGPSSYSRPDERINDEVHQRLTDDPWVDATDIQVVVQNGEVTLNGAVSDREAKRRAERCVEDIFGVKHVQNNLRAQDAASRNPLTSPGRGFGDNGVQSQGLTGQADDADKVADQAIKDPTRRL